MRILIVIWISCFSFVLNAQENNELFYQANEAFTAGQHAKAAEMYEQVLSGDYDNWELHYNLGNAYYELNQPGKAALHFRKAERMVPSNKAIAKNLELLEGKIALKAERFPMLFYKRWYQSVLKSFSSRTWLLLAVLLCWFAAGMYAYWVYTGRNRAMFRSSALGAAFFSLLFLFFTWQMDSFQFNKEHGVLMAEEVKIKNGPSSKSKEIFTLSAGNTLQVLGREKSWFKVRFRDGREGWIEKRVFEII